MENIYKILIVIGIFLTAIAGYLIFAGYNYSGEVFISGIAVYLVIVVLSSLEGYLVKEVS